MTYPENTIEHTLSFLLNREWTEEHVLADEAANYPIGSPRGRCELEVHAALWRMRGHGDAEFSGGEWRKPSGATESQGELF